MIMIGIAGNYNLRFSGGNFLPRDCLDIQLVMQGRRRGSGWSGHGPTSFGKKDFRQRAIAATSGLGIDD